MAHMRGLELVCIGRNHSFELRYEDGRYLDRKGKDVEDLLDMTCFECGAAYYTLEEEAVPFCPNCGRFEKMRHEQLADLLQWSRGQNFDFLRFSGQKAFALESGDGWVLAFAADEEELRRRGVRGEIHEV